MLINHTNRWYMFSSAVEKSPDVGTRWRQRRQRTVFTLKRIRFTAVYAVPAVDAVTPLKDNVSWHAIADATSLHVLFNFFHPILVICTISSVCYGKKAVIMCIFKSKNLAVYCSQWHSYHIFLARPLEQAPACLQDPQGTGIQGRKI